MIFMEFMIFGILQASQNYQRTQCQWNLLTEEAIELEDVAVNEVNIQRSFRSSLHKYDGIFKRCYTPAVGE